MPLKGSTFEDRRNAAADAKKALVERFKARPAADDPTVQAKAAERKAIQEARDIRQAERSRVKAEEQARLNAADEARKIADAAAHAEAEARLVDTARRDEEIRAERKAARDAKYAARKSRLRR